MPRIPGVNNPGNPDGMTVGNRVGAVVLCGVLRFLGEISTGVGMRTAKAPLEGSWHAERD